MTGYNTGRFRPNIVSFWLTCVDIARGELAWLRKWPRPNPLITKEIRAFLRSYYERNELPKDMEVIEWDKLTILIKRQSGNGLAARFEVLAHNHWIGSFGRFPQQRNFVMLVSGRYICLTSA